MKEEKFPIFHKLIATSFGAGFSPVAPGTMGALFAVAVWYLLFALLDYATLMW